MGECPGAASCSQRLLGSPSAAPAQLALCLLPFKDHLQLSFPTANPNQTVPFPSSFSPPGCRALHTTSLIMSALVIPVGPQEYLNEICRAIRDSKVRIIGWLAWSFMDGWEWREG
jgi:hypothetical protein